MVEKKIKIDNKEFVILSDYILIIYPANTKNKKEIDRVRIIKKIIEKKLSKTNSYINNKIAKVFFEVYQNLEMKKL